MEWRFRHVGAAEVSRREAIITRLIDEIISADGVCRFCEEVDHHPACRVYQLINCEPPSEQNKNLLLAFNARGEQIECLQDWLKRIGAPICESAGHITASCEGFALAGKPIPKP